MDFTDFTHTKCDCAFCQEDVNDLVDAMHMQGTHMGIIKALMEYMSELDSDAANDVLAGILGTACLIISQGKQKLANRMLDAMMEVVISAMHVQGSA